MTMKHRTTVILLAGLLAICLAAGVALGGGEFRKRSADHESATGAGSIGTGEADVLAELQFGREVAARILGREGLYDDPELTRYVNLVGQAVSQHTDRPELDFRVAVLDTDDINAYAAPGGYIFVTRGAIAQMEDEAELAAVISHEIAHVTRRHIVDELGIKGEDSSVVAGLARFIGGAGDPVKIGFIKLVDKAMDILYDRGYKLEDEKEADATAAMYLSFTGYNPNALVRYLNRIKSVKGDPMSVLTKTHPSFDDRVEHIQNIMAEEGLEGAQYKLGKERFDAIKKNI